LQPLSRDSSCSGTSRISKRDRRSSHDPAGHQQQYCIGEIGLCSVVAAELAYGVEKSGSIRNRQAL
jgi:predicted nucleic acid-binding protein